MLDSMVTRLEKYVRGQVIRKVDCKLMWGPEPSAQGNCDSELGAKGQLESLQPDVPVFSRGLLQQVAWEGNYLWENNVAVDGGAIT